MRQENHIDWRQILDADARPAKPVDEKKPVREDGVDEEVDSRKLQKKRRVPDECDSKLIGLCDDRFVLLADGSPEGGFSDEFESEAKARAGKFSGQSNLQGYRCRRLREGATKPFKARLLRRLLLLGVRSGNGCFGGLKTHFRVRAVAEGLVGRCAAAAERNGRFSRKIPLGSVGIDQLDCAFYAIGAVGAHSDFYFVF
jgi:hypothetical protein